MPLDFDQNHHDLKNARANGENLAELLALYTYFIKHTPEGRLVGQELEKNWQESVQVLRERKAIIGADFTLVGWLEQIRKELLADKKPDKPIKKAKTRPVRPPRKKVLRFRGINT